MKSALYQGWVKHRRLSPMGHAFRYRVFMPYLDLDELPWVLKRAPFWSARMPALARFRRTDFMGDPEVSLKAAVLNRVEEETGERPMGPVRMLANLRYFGFIMNPICCYYCFAEDGETLQYVVAEVTNTPWNDRHSYVLKAPETGEWLETHFDKQMHVSPFHPMDMQYRWRSNNPAENLIVHLANYRENEQVFDATLTLERHPVTASRMALKLLSYPFMTARIGLAIYWQALVLWCKGAPFYSNPGPPTVRTQHEQ